MVKLLRVGVSPDEQIDVEAEFREGVCDVVVISGLRARDGTLFLVSGAGRWLVREDVVQLGLCSWQLLQWTFHFTLGFAIEVEQVMAVDCLRRLVWLCLPIFRLNATELLF